MKSDRIKYHLSIVRLILILGITIFVFPIFHDIFFWGQINIGIIDSCLFLIGIETLLLWVLLLSYRKARTKKILKLSLWINVLLLILSIVILPIIIKRKSHEAISWRIITYKLRKNKEGGELIVTKRLSEFNASLVTDIKADFVADPITIKFMEKHYCFFEVGYNLSSKADIAVAESIDGVNWNYEKVVLSEGFHLSFPLVFNWDSVMYMIPESSADHSIRLYKSNAFPFKWSLDTILMEGAPYMDNVIYRKGEYWYLFTSTSNSNLFLYYSTSLHGSWKPHPMNPIISDFADGARMAGKIIMMNDSIIRVGQDDYPNYGNNVRTFLITELDTLKYQEVEINLFPNIKSEISLFSNGIHTCSLIENDSLFIVVVDEY